MVIHDFGFALKTRERLDPVSLGKLSCSLVPEANDHARILVVIMCYVKHNVASACMAESPVTASPAYGDAQDDDETPVNPAPGSAKAN